MSTRSLLNLDPDPQVTRVTGHSELTDLKLADLPTSKLIGSRELLGVVASPITGRIREDVGMNREGQRNRKQGFR